MCRGDLDAEDAVSVLRAAVPEFAALTNEFETVIAAGGYDYV
jgi:hypothetical protein